MHELLGFARKGTLTQGDQAKLNLLSAQLLAISKKIVGLLEPTPPNASPSGQSPLRKRATVDESLDRLGSFFLAHKGTA